MALATVLGLAVRLFLAGWSEVWLDEAYSALLAVSETGELLRHLQVDAHPPLYYLILKGWTALTSLDPLILRLPSLLFGTAAIPAVWVVASRMDQPRAGMAAAWLLALHPLHVYYSQEARSYALLSLLALGLYYALFHLLSREGRVLPAVLLGSALAYTHYFGLVFTGTTLLAAFLVMPGRRRKVVLSGLGIGLAYLPWLPLFWAQLRNSEMVAWMAHFWDLYPGAFAVFRSFQTLLPGGLKYAFVPLEGLPFQLPLVIFGLLPFIWVGWRAILRRRRGRAPTSGPELNAPFLPLLVAVLPLLVLVIRSYLSEPVYLVGRSELLVLPILVVALAWAVVRMPKWPGLVFLGIWLVLSTTELWISADRLQKPGNARLAAALDALECTEVVAEGYSFAPMMYYEMLEAPETRALVVPFPQDVAEHPGYYAPGQYSPEELAAGAAAVVREHPPGPGLCVLAAGRSFSGPLAQAYRSMGANPLQRRVFHTSLLEGIPFVLVTFEG